MQWGRIVRIALLLPILPVLQWGPFVHPYVNARALERAEEESRRGNRELNQQIVDACRMHRDAFVFGGNSADIISNFHVTNDIYIYDYAHNNCPNNALGVPGFGYMLLHEWFSHSTEEGWTSRDLAVACGWLGHQLADFHPHYAPVDREGQLLADPKTIPDETTVFSGYCDAHRVLGTDYYSVILKDQVRANHALTELFHDIVCIHRDMHSESPLFSDPDLTVTAFEHLSGDCSVEPLRDNNLLTRTSERLKGLCPRIPPEHIPHMVRSFHYVISGIRVLAEMGIEYRPLFVRSLEELLDHSMVEQSVQRVYEGLFMKSLSDCADIAGLFRSNISTYYEFEKPQVRCIDKSGSQIFSAISSIRKKLPQISSSCLLEAVRDPVRLVPTPILRCIARLAWLVASGTVSGSLARALRFALTQIPMDDGIRSYLSAVISDPDCVTDKALLEYSASLRPRLTIVDEAGRDVLLDHSHLSAALDGGEIRVRATPAGSRTAGATGRTERALDLETLIFRIDGYDITHRQELFEVVDPPVFVEDDPCGEILMICRINGPLHGEFHHLFVDIRDRSGVGAERIDLELRRAPACQEASSHSGGIELGEEPDR